jgi:hypothetical protein
MTFHVLQVLGTDEFSDGIGFVLPPAPMRRVLQTDPRVRALESALRYHQVREAELREFVGCLLSEFRPGDSFRYDIALAALAVAMQHWRHPVAEEYLLDLARVDRPEFRCSFRVARECLKARYAFPRTQVRISRYPRSVGGRCMANRNLRPMPLARLSPRAEKVHWVRYSEVDNAST